MVGVDELMTRAWQSKQISKLFTEDAHKKNFNRDFSFQNLFYQGREMRTISLNAHYLVLSKKPRDKSQIRYLANQIFPENSKFRTNV